MTFLFLSIMTIVPFIAWGRRWQFGWSYLIMETDALVDRDYHDIVFDHRWGRHCCQCQYWRGRRSLFKQNCHRIIFPYYPFLMAAWRPWTKPERSPRFRKRRFCCGATWPSSLDASISWSRTICGGITGNISSTPSSSATSSSNSWVGSDGRIEMVPRTCALRCCRRLHWEADHYLTGWGRYVDNDDNKLKARQGGVKLRMLFVSSPWCVKHVNGKASAQLRRRLRSIGTRQCALRLCDISPFPETILDTFHDASTAEFYRNAAEPCPFYALVSSIGDFFWFLSTNKWWSSFFARSNLFSPSVPILSRQLSRLIHFCPHHYQLTFRIYIYRLIHYGLLSEQAKGTEWPTECDRVHVHMDL